MYHRGHFARTTLYVALALMLLAGCATRTTESPEVSPTAVATSTPLEGTRIPEPTQVLLPTEPVPETPSVTPASPTAPPAVTPGAQIEPPYEDRDDPVRLLASYFNAVNRQEYARAYGYWEEPPDLSYEDFAQAYSNTLSVLLAVHPPVRVEGTAGSLYAAIPTLLTPTYVDGSQRSFVGCYIAHRSNPDMGDDTADPGWSLYIARATAAPGDGADTSLLTEVCEDLAGPESHRLYDDREDPVRLLASYYNAVDRKEYERAYGYWETPPSPSYEQFVEGYADTESVLLVVRPPTRLEGAAGSQYTSIAALVVATHTDGSQHSFLGCYTARRPNPEMGGADAEAVWSLYSATITAAPGNSTDTALLAGLCTMGQDSQ